MLPNNHLDDLNTSSLLYKLSSIIQAVTQLMVKLMGMQGVYLLKDPVQKGLFRESHAIHVQQFLL